MYRSSTGTDCWALSRSLWNGPYSSRKVPTPDPLYWSPPRSPPTLPPPLPITAAVPVPLLDLNVQILRREKKIRYRYFISPNVRYRSRTDIRFNIRPRVQSPYPRKRNYAWPRWWWRYCWRPVPALPLALTPPPGQQWLAPRPIQGQYLHVKRNDHKMEYRYLLFTNSLLVVSASGVAKSQFF